MSQKKKTDHSSDQASAVCYKAAMPALQILCCKESDQPRQPWCFVQQKTSCRIMGVVPQPCSEWEVERVLRAAAKAPMQGSCSYSASWRHICVVHAALGVLLVLVPAAQAQEVVALGLFLTQPV